MSERTSMMLFYAAVLGAVALLVFGIFRMFEAEGGESRRVAKRMRTLAVADGDAGPSASLRRDAARRGGGLLPESLALSIGRQLTQAGMTISPQRLVTLMAGASATIAIGFPLLGGIFGQIHSVLSVLLVMVFGIALGVVLPYVVITRRAGKRVALFEAQFPTALDIFVRGLRAGHPVQSALMLLVEECPEPIRSEFGAVLDEMNYGYDLRRALANVAERIGAPDVKMFVVSVSIQSETGGNLADILDGLSRVIRERASMVLKVRALSSEGKMTAMVLSVLPVGTFCFIFATQPKFYLDAVDDSWFLPGVAGMLFMYTCGITLMNKMIKIKV